MEGQNYQALSLEQCLLEPHNFGSINLTVCAFIIALYCAIINSLGNLFGLLLLVVMASLAGLAVAQAQITIELALLSHGVLIIHADFLSALIEHQYLFVGTLYKTLDKYHQVCYNSNQRDMFDQFISP